MKHKNPSGLISFYFSFLVFAIFFFSAHAAHASASLTISSATLASDGKTLTVNMSGASGTLSPASGITGFVLHNGTLGSGGTSFDIKTATSSGSVVTLTLNAFVPSSTVVTLDLATSSASNLTDTGADTPTGQTNVSVTNNSTKVGTSFIYTNPSLYFIATITTSSVGTAGRSWIQIQSSKGDFFETTVVGTDAQALMLGSETNVTITVDGVPTTVTTSTIPASRWAWVNLFSGLSDASHTVKITATLGQIYFDQTSSIQAFGSAPAVQAPTGFGTFTTMNTISANSNAIIDGNSTTTTASFHANTLEWPYGDGAVRFRASITDLWGFVWQAFNVPFYVYQDGVQISTTTTNGSSTFDLLHFASGLDGLAHNYEIVSAAYNPAYIWALMLTGTGFTSNSFATKTIQSWYGDSITAGTGLTTPRDERFLSTWLVTRPLGQIGAHVGNSGTLVTTFGRDNTGQLTNYSQKPTRVWIRYGHNDALANIATGSVGASGTFIGDYYTMLVNMRAGLPSSTPLMIEKILPTTAYGNATNTVYNNAIATALTAYRTNTGDNNEVLIDTTNWVDPSNGIDTTDGTHPTAAGYIKIANREMPYATSTGYLVTGPTSGTVNVTSTNFTVTIASGATFTGDETVSVSDGGNGGIFVPSVGSSATSSITITPATSTTSFTFTYTPVSVGAKTLTFTNGQNWTDVSSTTYTAVGTTSTAPQSLVATPGNAQVALSWSVPSSTGGSALTQYLVYDRTTGSSTFAQIATTSPSTTTSTILSLTNGQSYDFEIIAQNGIGTSTPSNVVTSTPTAPILITAFSFSSTTITLGSSSVLTFTTTGTVSTSTLSGNNLNISTLSASGSVTVTPNATGTLTYTFVALNVNTSSTATTTITVNPAIVVTPPTLSAPTSSAVSTSTTTLTATISSIGNASATSEGFNYGTSTAYGLVASTTGSFGTGSFNQNLSGLTPSTTYHFQAFATNSAGTGTSTDATFTTTSTAPAILPVVPPSVIVSVAAGYGGTGTSSTITNSSNTSSTTSSTQDPSSAIQAMIASLTVQLNALLAQANATGVSTTGTITPVFTRNLSFGMTGTDVQQLQLFLVAQNIGAAAKKLAAHGTTKNFGSLTLAALIEFQKAVNIMPASGFFGPITKNYVSGKATL